MSRKKSLAILFLFWTMICIGIPLLLLIFLLKSMEIQWRQDLLVQIEKSQLSLRDSIESFYKDQWMKGLQEDAFRTLQDYTLRIERLHTADSIDLRKNQEVPAQQRAFYNNFFLTPLGIQINESRHGIEDLNSPIRLQLVKWFFKEPLKDYLDVLAKTIDIGRIQEAIQRGKYESEDQRRLLVRAKELSRRLILWNHHRLHSEPDKVLDSQDLKDSGYLDLKSFLAKYWDRIHDIYRFKIRRFWEEYFIQDNRLLSFEKHILDVDWDSLKVIIEPAVRLVIMDETGTYPGYGKLLKIAAGIDLDQLVYRWFLMGTGSQRYHVLMYPFPGNFSRERYLNGQIPPPEMLSATIIKENNSVRLFSRIINAMEDVRLIGTSQQRIREVDRVLSLESEVPGISVQEMDRNMITGLFKLIPAQEYGSSESGYEFIRDVLNRLWDLLFRQVDTEMIYRKNQLLWNRSTKLQLLPTEKLTNYLKGIGVQEAVTPESIGHRGVLIPYGLPNGKSRTTRILPSSQLEGFWFVFTLPDDVAFRDIAIHKGLIYTAVFIAILLALIIVKALSIRIIEPILTLTRQMEVFEPGEREFKSSLSIRRDEIGEMVRNLEIMNHSVYLRIRELEAVNDLNLLMLSGHSFQTLKEEFIQSTCRLMGTEQVFLSFYDWKSPSMPLSVAVSSFLSNSLNKAQVQEILMEIQLRTKDWSPGVYPLFQPLDSLRSLGYQTYSLVLLRAKLSSSESSGKEPTHPASIVLLGDLEAMDVERNSFLMSYASELLSLFQRDRLEEMRNEAQRGSLQQIQSMVPEISNLPGRLEVTASFLPARFLGGDFVDMIWRPREETLDLVISDVSGKGMGSALFGETAKILWKLGNENYDSPALVLHELNQQLCRESFPSLFMTIFHMRISLKTKEYEFASGGHNQMITLCTKTGKLKELSAKGLPLGMFEQAEYHSEKGVLKDSDLLFLYTDGVTELENPDQELFGFQRLASFLRENRSLSPGSMKTMLSERLDSYREGAPLSDDISFIIFGSQS